MALSWCTTCCFLGTGLDAVSQIRGFNVRGGWMAKNRDGGVIRVLAALAKPFNANQLLLYYAECATCPFPQEASCSFPAAFW
jgi:hypothetical protein